MEKGILWIIDDDMVSQFAIKYKIEQSHSSYKVISYYSVEEALDAIRACLNIPNDLPDKVLLDLELPGTSGWFFLAELEKIYKGMSSMEIYIVSAFSNSSDRKLAKENPLIKGYFDKPLNKAAVDQIFMSSKK